MAEDLFRKKSLDHITSPEEMHNYMRVTSPRLWMILSAITLLLIGFIVYASTTTLENTAPMTLNIYSSTEVNERLYYGYMAGEDLTNMVKVGMQVRFDDHIGTVDSVAVADNQVVFMINFEDDMGSYADGEYQADLIIESTTPVSFLWN